MIDIGNGVLAYEIGIVTELFLLSLSQLETLSRHFSWRMLR